MACALLKRANFLHDTQGIHSELYYLRDRERREVDFLTVAEQRPEYLVEVKTSDDVFAPSLRYFSERVGGATAIQLVYGLEKPITNRFGSILNTADWLAGLEA